MLVPDRPVRLLALGHLARNSAPTSVNQLVEPLTAINYLVVSAVGDVQQVLEAVRRIKEKNPRLKVTYFLKKTCLCKKNSGDSR